MMGDRYKLIDLQSTSNDEILRKKHLGMLEFFLKSVNQRKVDLLEIWRTALERFVELTKYDANFGYIYILRFLSYTEEHMEADQKEQLQKLIEAKLEEGEKFMYTIADSYRDEGFSMGIVQGKEEGIIQIALNLLKEHEPIEKVARITQLSTEKLLQLKQLLRS
jgi:predicted transposase/invertase (TIGR01784 family)